MNDQPPLDYVGAHLEEALATDGRVGEQGVHVAVDGDGLVVAGTVSTAERRSAVDDIAREVAHGVVVRNDVVVVTHDGHPDAEHLA